MKNIKERLIKLFFEDDYCTPKISKIARKIQEPSTTIHYNIKQMEKNKEIINYKPVFNYKKINKGFCSFVLLSLSPNTYDNPEDVAKIFAKYEEVESVDIITGDWEMILKIRTKDINEYYNFVKKVLSIKDVIKIKSLISLKQIKTEFTMVD